VLTSFFYMAHQAQIQFCLSVKERFPQYFKNVRVFDGGSLDINGNNRYLFEEYTYIGVDVGEGSNVDVVCNIGDYKGDDNSFDVVISTECFEHDMEYSKSLQNMVRMCDGIMLFTCATTGRPEHGTKRTRPESAPLLEWDYYKNVTEEMVREAIDLSVFKEYEFSTNKHPADLYFWGILD